MEELISLSVIITYTKSNYKRHSELQEQKVTSEQFSTAHQLTREGRGEVKFQAEGYKTREQGQQSFYGKSLQKSLLSRSMTRQRPCWGS